MYRLRFDAQTMEVEDAYIDGISLQFYIVERTQGPSEPDGLGYAGSHAFNGGFTRA